MQHHYQTNINLLEKYYEYVSDGLAPFCCGLGSTTMSYFKFSDWIYYSISESFPILQLISIFFA